MGCKTTGQVARQLRMTAKELYRELKERDILYKSDGIWMLTPAYAFQNLLRYRYTLYYTLLGEEKVRVYPVWTEKGLKFLTEEFQDVWCLMEDGREETQEESEEHGVYGA